MVLFAVFLIGIAFFLWWTRASNPVLDLSLFNNRVYNFSVLSAMMASLALFAVNFLIVFYLQGVLGYDPLKAALLLIPLPVMTSIIAPEETLLTGSERGAGNCGAADPRSSAVVVHPDHAAHALLADCSCFGDYGSGRRVILPAQYKRSNERST